MRRSFLVIRGSIIQYMQKALVNKLTPFVCSTIVVSLTNRIELYNDWLDFHDVQIHRIQK